MLLKNVGCRDITNWEKTRIGLIKDYIGKFRYDKTAESPKMFAGCLRDIFLFVL
jgi:hypothetical protein